jgi:hypothetical protein
VIAKYNQEKLAGSLNATLRLNDSKELITQLVQEYSHVTLVIDGLDECSSRTRGELFLFLMDLVKQKLGPLIKILISSRNEPDIWDVFNYSSNLYIDASDNADDIKCFVEQEVDKRLLSGKAEDELKTRVKTKLCEKAHGM